MANEVEKILLPMALRQNGGYAKATEWYTGWTPLPYQWAWHHLPQVNTTIVAGIATGKTSGGTASFLADCLTIPYFGALTTSVTAFQAELSFQMFNSWYETSEKLKRRVKDITLKPFPRVEFDIGSYWDFRTAGVDGRFIRGSEYDRILFDEAGLDLVGYIIKVLRGRLRGKRPDGTTRMARLDVISSPTEAPWLKERYDLGDPEYPSCNTKLFRSMRVATWDNTHLDREQVEAMIAEYPPDLAEVELGGNFPTYGLSMFPAGNIAACTDISMYDAATEAVHPSDGKNEPGWIVNEDARHGTVHFEMPFNPAKTYILSGDPGTDSFPRRNAGVVVVCDVTDKNNKRLVYFDWVPGKGSYNPFLRSFKYAMEKYHPVFRGIDATGTQKGLDEVAFSNQGIHTDKIRFNVDKIAALNMLIDDITNHRYRWPPIKGLIRQLQTYTPESDKEGNPQDIVMALAQVSLLAIYMPEPESEIVNRAQAHKNFYNRRRRTNVKVRR